MNRKTLILSVLRIILLLDVILGYPFIFFYQQQHHLSLICEGQGKPVYRELILPWLNEVQFLLIVWVLSIFVLVGLIQHLGNKNMTLKEGKNKRDLTFIIIIVVGILLGLFIHWNLNRRGWESIPIIAPVDMGEQFNPASYANISNQSSGQLGH